MAVIRRPIDQSPMLIQSMAFYFVGMVFFLITPSSLDSNGKLFISSILIILGLLINFAIFFPGSKYADSIQSIASSWSIILFMIISLLVLMYCQQYPQYAQVLLVALMAYSVLVFISYGFIIKNAIAFQQQIFGVRFAWLRISLVGCIVFAVGGILGIYTNLGISSYLFWGMSIVLLGVSIVLQLIPVWRL